MVSTSEQNHARQRQCEVHVTLPYVRMVWWYCYWRQVLAALS